MPDYTTPDARAHHHHLNVHHNVYDNHHDTTVHHDNIECASPNDNHLLFGPACRDDHTPATEDHHHYRTTTSTPAVYNDLPTGDHYYYCSAGHHHDGVPSCPLVGSRVVNHPARYDDHIDPAVTSP